MRRTGPKKLRGEKQRRTSGQGSARLDIVASFFFPAKEPRKQRRTHRFLGLFLELRLGAVLRAHAHAVMVSGLHAAMLPSGCPPLVLAVLAAVLLLSFGCAGQPVPSSCPPGVLFLFP